MNLVYLPAIYPSMLSERWACSSINAMDPRLRGTEAYHPFALVSAAETEWHTRRFQWEPDEFIFGDSGGYSVAKRGIHLDPCDVMRWQLAFSTVGAVLDVPPWSDWSRSRECLAATVANVKAAVPIYRRALEADTPFRWWGVVHGRTRAELEEWWKAITKVYPFTGEGEGWAFKPQPLNDPEAVAEVLAFIADKGIRRAHFFASSAVNAVEVLYAYGADAGLVCASVDSTSPLKLGRNRVLILSAEYGLELLTERFRETKGRDTCVRDYMRRDCRCRSCEFLKTDVDADEGLMRDESYLYHRIMFHNVLAMLRAYEKLNARYTKAAKPLEVVKG